MVRAQISLDGVRNLDIQYESCRRLASSHIIEIKLNRVNARSLIIQIRHLCPEACDYKIHTDRTVCSAF
jgi:hypothetical protein